MSRVNPTDDPFVIDLRELTYVGSGDEILVVFAVGYKREDFDDESRFTPDIHGALQAALELITHEGSNDTHWWVLDRESDATWGYWEQGDFE